MQKKRLRCLTEARELMCATVRSQNVFFVRRTYYSALLAAEIF